MGLEAPQQVADTRPEAAGVVLYEAVPVTRTPLTSGLWWVAATALAVSMAPRPAEASGFDAPSLGSGQSSPVARDAAAVHYNPGQLGYIDRTELDVGLGVIVGALSYQRDRRGQYQYGDNFDFAEPIDPADIDPNRTGASPAVSARPVGPLIDAFLAIPVVPKRLTLGVGFYLPYVAQFAMPMDGAQRFQAQAVTLVSTHTTFSAGVRLHDVISLGAGVSYVLSVMQLSKVQDFAAVGAFGDGLAAPPINQANDFGPNAPSSVRELDLLARQADIGPAWSHGVSFNVGAAIRPTDKLDLALVYQHGSRQRLRGDFTLDMDDEFFTQDLAAQGLQFPAVVRGEALIELSLPKRLTVGAGYQVHPKVSIDGSASYVFYSDFDVVDITLTSPDLAQPALGIGESVPQPLVRNWRNTVHGEFSVRGQATPKLRVSGTVGYQSGASPDSTVDMSSPDGHRLIGAAGVEYAFSERFSLLGDIRVQGIVPRTVTDSDFDLGNGTYRLVLAAASAHAKIRFGGRGRSGRRDRKAEQGADERVAPAEADTDDDDASVTPGPETGADGPPPDDSAAPQGDPSGETVGPAEADVPPPPPPPPPAAP